MYMYIYVYIYIHIYIYISCYKYTYIYIYLQQDVMLFDVIWLMFVRFLVHIQNENSKANIAGPGTA